MGAESHTAFFSYSREDSDFAKRLAADLKANGAGVWMDQLDIEPGARWDDAVSAALESSPRVLVILSPASAKSENVSDEVGFALSKLKHVIPVLYRDCDVPFRIARLQYVDFRNDYSSGLQELTRVLSLQPPAASDIVPPRPIEASPRPALEPARAKGTNKQVLVGGAVALVILLGVIGYFGYNSLAKPELDVTILAPAGFTAPHFTVDGKSYPIAGQAVHLKLAPGDHRFLFPKTNCSGTFTVAPDRTTFLPKADDAGHCALQPVSN